MKISDVCERTGLTDRTIRFYIEKGLFKKEATQNNGRNCRDYAETDIGLLKDIAVLRNFEFSIQDILDMQQNSETIERLVEEKYIELKNRYEWEEQILMALGKARGRKGLSWQRLAGILNGNIQSQGEKIVFRWPEEGGEKQEKPDGTKWRKKEKIVVGIMVFCLIMICGVLKYGHYC